MRVDWNDSLKVYQRDEEHGRYEASEDDFGTYEALLAVKIELEEQIRNSPQADPLDHIDDDLKAIRGMGAVSDEELLLLHERRHATDKVDAVEAPTAEKAPTPGTPPALRCPRNPGGGGHIASSYMRHSNGTLLGKCQCGATIQSPDCPHHTQTLRGNKVVCAECGRPQINNVGHWDNEVEQATQVDPNKFKP